MLIKILISIVSSRLDDLLQFLVKKIPGFVKRIFAKPYFLWLLLSAAVFWSVYQRNWSSLIIAFIALLPFLFQRFKYLTSMHELDEVLYKISEEMDVEHEYSEYKFIYEIDSGRRDKWKRKIKAKPTKEKVIALKRMTFGVRGEESDSVDNFKKLNIQTYTNPGNLRLIKPVPKSEEGGEYYTGNFIFTQPIQPEEDIRTATIKGIWPNLWGDLRETGEDKGSVEMDKKTEKLKIVIKFPHQVSKQNAFSLTPEKVKIPKEGGETITKEKPNLGEVTTGEDEDTGRMIVEWQIENVEPGQYFEYSVNCPGLPELLSKRGYIKNPFSKFN